MVDQWELTDWVPDYPANLDKETPDISGFQLPPFSDNRELFASIANK